MREPLPNELLIEAWKAMVGWVFERILTQRAYGVEWVRLAAERLIKRKRGTHSNPSRHQIDLVQHVDHLLALLLLRQVRLNTLAAGTERVAGVENVEEDVGRVDDLRNRGSVRFEAERRRTESGRTLYSSPQIRLLVPADKM